MWKEPQLNALLRIGISAGKEILSVYNQAGEIDVTIKDDSSPLTEADRLAHQLIVAELRKLTPDVPILSEESGETPAQERLEWSRFWLVDPLDGTKEFIKRRTRVGYGPCSGKRHELLRSSRHWGLESKSRR